MGSPHEQPPPRFDHRGTSPSVSPTELSQAPAAGHTNPRMSAQGSASVLPPASPHRGALPSPWGPHYALLMSQSEWPENVTVPDPHACPADVAERPHGCEPPVPPAGDCSGSFRGQQGMNSKYAPAGCLKATRAGYPPPSLRGAAEATRDLLAPRQWLHGSGKWPGHTRNPPHPPPCPILEVSQLYIHSFGYAVQC